MILGPFQGPFFPGPTEQAYLALLDFFALIGRRCSAQYYCRPKPIRLFISMGQALSSFHIHII